MSPKRILVTGASGCVGHYLAETLIHQTNHELYLLVRSPEKLQFDFAARPNVHIIQADLRDIDRHSKLLKTIEVAILAATAWGGSQAVFDTNVGKTVQLMKMLDLEVCEQIIYFSTASLLDRNNEFLREANQLGTDYIRSKYECIQAFSRLPVAKKVTTLFPTLVLGGDVNHPYSHLTAGLPDVSRWVKFIRFFKAEGSFHFIHAKDIAQIVLHLVENPPQLEESRKLILGNQPVTVNQAIEEVCAYLGKKIYFQIELTPWMADIIIAIFKIQMAAWDRFCVEYRHFTYQNPISPETYGLPTYCPTFLDVLKLSGVGEKQKTSEELKESISPELETVEPTFEEK